MGSGLYYSMVELPRNFHPGEEVSGVGHTHVPGGSGVGNIVSQWPQELVIGDGC